MIFMWIRSNKETDDKNIDNEIEISNIDDDDDIDSNEEDSPYQRQSNQRIIKENEMVQPEIQRKICHQKKPLSPPNHIVVKRADTSKGRLQQQYHNQQEQQKELKFSTPSILVKSNSWSPMNDTESEVCDIDINTIDRMLQGLYTSADRRINVLSMVLMLVIFYTD